MNRQAEPPSLQSPASVAREDLENSRDQLEVIIQSVQDGISVQDRSGRTVYANAAAARLVGYESASAFMQAPQDEILSRFTILDEQGEPMPLDRLPGRLVFEDGQPRRQLIRFRIPATGEERWSHVEAYPVFDDDGQTQSVISVFRDVTDQRRRERASAFLAEASTTLASSLDYETTLGTVARLAVPELADWCVVHVVEEDGTIKPLAVMHVDPSKVELAREAQRRFPPDPGSSGGAPQVVRTGGAVVVQEITDEMLVASARNPEHLAIMRELGFRSAMAVALVARDRILGAITFVSAESGKRYTDDDLALAQDLARRAAIAVDNARLYEEAQEALRLRDEFLSIASHELRTPLTSLQLQVQLFERLLAGNGGEPAGDRAERMVAGMERHVKRLSGLIDELLDVSRIRSGHLTLDPSQIDLAILAREVCDRFAEELAASGSELTLRAEEPVAGRWDRFRLDQVITNLVSNAIKYGQGGPVEVIVSSGEGVATLTVRDHGIGIPPEDIARIFDRFERVVSVRNYGGLGLGLYITRQIVDAHGGTMRVDSRVGEGSTFTVELPPAAQS